MIDAGLTNIIRISDWTLNLPLLSPHSLDEHLRLLENLPICVGYQFIYSLDDLFVLKDLQYFMSGFVEWPQQFPPKQNDFCQ